MKIRLSKPGKTQAEKNRELRKAKFDAKTREMQADFKTRERKALELEKQMDRHEAEVEKLKNSIPKLDRQIKTANTKQTSAQRRLDAFKRRMQRDIDSMQREVDMAAKLTSSLEASKNAVEVKIADAPKRAAKLQAKIDSAFKSKNSLEDRLAKRVKAPKEHDLLKG